MFENCTVDINRQRGNEIEAIVSCSIDNGAAELYNEIFNDDLEDVYQLDQERNDSLNGNELKGIEFILIFDSIEELSSKLPEEINLNYSVEDTIEEKLYSIPAQDTIDYVLSKDAYNELLELVCKEYKNY